MDFFIEYPVVAAGVRIGTTCPDIEMLPRETVIVALFIGCCIRVSAGSFPELSDVQAQRSTIVLNIKSIGKIKRFICAF